MPSRAAVLLSKHLIVLALFVRALMPTGWMPVVEDGALALQPCPTTGISIPVGTGAEPMAMEGHGGHHQSQDHEGHERSASETCPFGVVSTGVADLPPPHQFQQPEIGNSRDTFVILKDIPVLSRERRPSLARAPPNLA